MNIFEKLYSVLAILFAVSLLTGLAIYPHLREFQNLVTLSLVGLLTNIGLLFIVIRDILTRGFKNSNQKYFWLVLVLLLWPSILFYLFKHGFLPRTGVDSEHEL